MTKKHFEAFAEAIGKEFSNVYTRHQVMRLFANVAKSFNPRFDQDKFRRRVESIAEKAFAYLNATPR